jgi:preprotein translocase subunit YajC
MPDRSDQAALQKFFFDEIQKGEELLAAGGLRVMVD